MPICSTKRFIFVTTIRRLILSSMHGCTFFILIYFRFGIPVVRGKIQDSSEELGKYRSKRCDHPRWGIALRILNHLERFCSEYNGE
jgi:hypothetical protein